MRVSSESHVQSTRLKISNASCTSGFRKAVWPYQRTKLPSPKAVRHYLRWPNGRKIPGDLAVSSTENASSSAPGSALRYATHNLVGRQCKAPSVQIPLMQCSLGRFCLVYWH